jgi:RNA polymerase sigma factor (TIGR02999 family)
MAATFCRTLDSAEHGVPEPAVEAQTIRPFKVGHPLDLKPRAQHAAPDFPTPPVNLRLHLRAAVPDAPPTAARLQIDRPRNRTGPFRTTPSTTTFAAPPQFSYALDPTRTGPVDMAANDACEPHPAEAEITRWLRRWSDGETGAADSLLPLVYQHLHLLARRLVRQPASPVELQPTELIAEAWLKLDRGELDATHRQHFFALSARVMRQVLVDHARKRLADKRGGGWHSVTLSSAGPSPDKSPVDVLALDQGLSRLAEIHPRAAQAVELHYFGGLTDAESAEQLGVTRRTVERDLRFGRAWLKDHLDVR